MESTSRVSSKNQFTLPSWVRKRLGIGPGSVVHLRETEDGVLIERTDESAERLRGAWKDLIGDPDAYVRELRDEWDRARLD